MAKAPTVDPNQATIDKYKALGLTDAASYVTKGKFDEAKAQTDLIKNVYKLDPALYTDKNFDAATQKYQFEKADVTLPKSKPESFTQALGYYSDILSQAEKFGINNLNTNYQNALKDAAKLVRDFDSKNLSLDAKQAIANITEASDTIDSINEQRKNVEIQKYRSQGLEADGVTRLNLPKKKLKDAISNAYDRLVVEQDALRRLESTASRAAPKLNESLSRLGLSDIGVNIGSDFSQNKKLATGLEALKAENQLGTGTGGLAGKLNVDVTDDQILNDINTARKSQYKSLYDIGTAATTDLQSQLDQANKIYADLPAGRSKEEAKKSIDAIQSQLTSAQKDTLEAKGLYEGYQPVSGEQATSAISKFRESLRLPEERTLKQIDVIDPTIGATVRGLAKQYQAMAETPLGPTTTKQTEDLRNQIEQEAINQLKLGSTLGAEERRQYEQATRSAQSARGNIFGLGPAVQEAANIGAAAEQRKLARYGAAAAFLGSGETTGAATARDLGLRNALDQSRLGAAQGFIASGPTMYNLASQRLGTQQGMLNNYLAASQPLQTGQFQGASSAANPYGYVNPNAGFMGAQNAADIYKTLASYQAQTYGANVGAIASQPSGAQNFGAIASGISSFIPNISI